MGFGYFADGLGRGLMASAANRQGREDDDLAKLRKEKLMLEIAGMKEGAIIDRIARERQNAAEQSTKRTLTGLLYPGGTPDGWMQKDFGDKTSADLSMLLKRKELRDANRQFGMMTGMKMPDGSYMSPELIKTGVDAYKHLNPQPAKLSGDAMNAKLLNELANTDPATAQAIMNRVKAIGQAKSSKHITNINNTENYAAKKMLDLDIKDYESAVDAGNTAVKKIQNISALRSIPLETDGDPLVGWKNTALKVAGSFGVPVNMDKIANVDMAMSVSNRMALDILTDFKGATSEKEMKFSQEIAPQVAQPKVAREWLMDAAEAKARYDMEKAEFYSKYLDTNDSVEGAKRAWNKHKRSIPTLYGTMPKSKKPITWYRWKNAVISATIKAGGEVPTHEELVKEWEATHAAR